jgi:uncharacterized YceG family protein
MTEYGRGQSLPPWHPDDPLWGDLGRDGGTDAAQQRGVDPNTGQYHGHYADPYDTGAHQVAQQQGYYAQQQQQQQQPQHPQEFYGQGGYGNAGQAAPYDPRYAQGAPASHGGAVVNDPYGVGQQPGYYPAGGYPPSQQQQQQQQQQQGYPQQQQQRHPHQQQGHPGQFAGPGHQAGPNQYHAQPDGRPGAQQSPSADPETGWDPGPDLGEHAFFSDGDEEKADSDASGEDEPEGRKPKKRRRGCGCVAVSLLLVAGVGTAGWFGYDFYRTQIDPPDYSGKGSGEVQVKIPDGASIKDMGGVLQNAGVVRSAYAFVNAAEDESKAGGIQAGTYTLRKQMSGAAAVKLMLDPASQNSLIVSEGLRATKVYELIDKKLGEEKGTTEKVAKKADLGLPSWAEKNPEGFLFPSRYSVGEKSDPADVLREMVKRAKAEHTKVNLDAQAKKAGKSPEEILTIASLIQAEAQRDNEFGRVSRVIYNRLDKQMLLQFDSTINYAKGRSTLTTSVEDTKFDSPYNTYLNRGLPPAPIDNPGHQAIEAALKPTKGNWLYFVTVKPGDTRFTESKAEHDRNVEDFNEEQRKQKEN